MYLKYLVNFSLFIWGCRCSDVKSILDGGKEIELGEFPWVTGVADLETGKLFCGGSIISEVHVLTAARCVYRWLENGTIGVRDPGSLKVIAGDNNRMEDEVTEQILQVEKILVHPGFQYDESYQTPANSKLEQGTTEFQNDLAILVMRSPFNFTSGYVHPIQISGGLGPDAEETVTIVGWGITDKKQNTIPTGKALKKVDIPFTRDAKNPGRYGIFPEKETTFGFNAGIGGNKGLMGRCIGDPGSAVLCKKDGGSERIVKDVRHNEYEICGVVTFGIWCDRHFPSGQISNLKFYYDWIDSHINSYALQAYIAIGVVTILLGIVGIVALTIRKKKKFNEAYRV